MKKIMALLKNISAICNTYLAVVGTIVIAAILFLILQLASLWCYNCHLKWSIYDTGKVESTPMGEE